VYSILEKNLQVIPAASGFFFSRIIFQNSCDEYVCWSNFHINQIKMLSVNVKSLELLKIFKTITGFSPDLGLSNHAQKGVHICPFKRNTVSKILLQE
jgi:hypothetical protein